MVGDVVSADDCSAGVYTGTGGANIFVKDALIPSFAEGFLAQPSTEPLVIMLQTEPSMTVEDMKGIGCPSLIMSGEHDLIRQEHTLLIGENIPSGPKVLEAALRRYNGKALVNSVNGKTEVMEAVFPIVKKYGGVVVALTLDETGIPETSEGRIKIAEKIISTAEKYGIAKKDIVVDALTMAVSSDINAAKATLETVKYMTQKGINTILGVSNISFGLPNREIVTSTFFALALENGLSSAIMNPLSMEMKKIFYSFCLLKGFDKDCLDYINFSENYDKSKEIAASVAVPVIANVPAEKTASSTISTFISL